MSMRSPLFPPLIAVLAACGSPDVQPDAAVPPEAESTDTVARGATGGESVDTVAQQTSAWSREGLLAQPRMDRRHRQVAQDMGYAPGTTEWRPARIVLPTELVGAGAPGAASPGDLLFMLSSRAGWVASLGEDVWEATTRIWMESEIRSVGAVLLWGLKDDAVAGHDFRVHMQRDGERWSIERVEERFHCSRGVSEGGLCM
jgi:hypothetical protein